MISNWMYPYLPIKMHPIDETQSDGANHETDEQDGDGTARPRADVRARRDRAVRADRCVAARHAGWARRRADRDGVVDRDGVEHDLQHAVRSLRAPRGAVAHDRRACRACGRIRGGPRRDGGAARRVVAQREPDRGVAAGPRDRAVLPALHVLLQSRVRRAARTLDRAPRRGAGGPIGEATGAAADVRRRPSFNVRRAATRRRPSRPRRTPHTRAP